MRKNQWQELFHWDCKKKKYRDLRGVERSDTIFPNQWDIWGPHTKVDSWIWSFDPFCRISCDGKVCQQFKDRLDDKDLFKNNFTPPINTLEYLPEQHGLLYGNHKSCWYFKLPAKKDKNISSESANNKKTAI
jgi:hypothetical protein